MTAMALCGGLGFIAFAQPLAVSIMILCVLLRSGHRLGSTYPIWIGGAAVGVIAAWGLVIAQSLAWRFDIAGLRTASSSDPLAFLAIGLHNGVLAIMIGGIGAASLATVRHLSRSRGGAGRWPTGTLRPDPSSIDKLLQRRSSYEKALPELIAWMAHEGDAGLRRHLWRAVGNPWAGRHGVLALISELAGSRTPHDANDRRLVLDAIAGAMDESSVADVVSLMESGTIGDDRVGLVYTLGGIPCDRSNEYLVRLVRSGELTIPAIRALGNSRTPEAMRVLQELAESENPVVRREAGRVFRTAMECLPALHVRTPRSCDG